jgi:diacylglycerol kinase
MNPGGKPPSLWTSFRCASSGLFYVLRTQRNFRIHLVIMVLVIAAGLVLRLPLNTWAILVMIFGQVLVAEIFNTAAEVLVDLASPDYHPLAKLVKDMAAGAVFLSAFEAVVIGLFLLGPPLWKLLTG